jgi:hypothetical protein
LAWLFLPVSRLNFSSTPKTSRLDGFEVEPGIVLNLLVASRKALAQNPSFYTDTVLATVSEYARDKFPADICKKVDRCAFSYSLRDARFMGFLVYPVCVKHADRPTATTVLPDSKENFLKKTTFAPKVGGIGL